MCNWYKTLKRPYLRQYLTYRDELKNGIVAFGTTHNVVTSKFSVSVSVSKLVRGAATAILKLFLFLDQCPILLQIRNLRGRFSQIGLFSRRSRPIWRDIGRSFRRVVSL